MKKMQFYTVWYLILTLCFGLSTLNLAAPAGSPPPDLPPLSQDELEFFEKLFEGMDDKTLEALAQIGEEYIKEMEAQGKDPYEILKEPLFPPTEAPAPKEEPKPTVVQPPVIKLPEAKVDEARMILQNLVSALQSIQQKASTDRESKDLIAPWRYYIEDLIYFSHLLEQEKLFKFLLDKEFDQTYKNLKKLHENMMILDSLYHVPELNLQADRNYTLLGLSPIASFADVQSSYQSLVASKRPDAIKRKMAGNNPEELVNALNKNEQELDMIHAAYQEILANEQSREILYRILDTLQELVFTPNLIGDFKKLIAQYDPEALKIKEAQEKRETEARKEQEEVIKRRAIPSRPIFKTGSDFKPSGTADKNLGGASKGPLPIPAGSSNIGSKNDAGAGTAKKDDKKDAAKKKDDKKKDEKKKDDKKDKDKEAKPDKPKLPEVSKNLISRLEKTQEIFEELSDYLSKKAFTPNGKDGEASLTPKDILKDIDAFLIAELVEPYTSDNPSIVRAKQLIAVLTKITEIIHRLKKEVRNTIGLSRQEKREFKKAAEQLFDQYDKQIFKKDLQPLMNLMITPGLKVVWRGNPQDISKEKKYLLLGINEFGEDISSPKFDLLRTLNPLKEVEGEAPRPTNYLGQFKNAYQELVKELKPQPIVPGAPGTPALIPATPLAVG